MSAQRDWTEDSSHENGNYHCRCMICNHTFLGHKRRVLCKVCADTPATDTEVAELLASIEAGVPDDE